MDNLLKSWNNFNFLNIFELSLQLIKYIIFCWPIPLHAHHIDHYFYIIPFIYMVFYSFIHHPIRSIYLILMFFFKNIVWVFILKIMSKKICPLEKILETIYDHNIINANIIWFISFIFCLACSYIGLPIGIAPLVIIAPFLFYDLPMTNYSFNWMLMFFNVELYDLYINSPYKGITIMGLIMYVAFNHLKKDMIYSNSKKWICVFYPDYTQLFSIIFLSGIYYCMNPFFSATTFIIDPIYFHRCVLVILFSFFCLCQIQLFQSNQINAIYSILKPIGIKYLQDFYSSYEYKIMIYLNIYATYISYQVYYRKITTIKTENNFENDPLKSSEKPPPTEEKLMHLLRKKRVIDPPH